ncbi:MAG: HEAT repeat domain-containing protein [Lysobacterales bacterium]
MIRAGLLLLIGCTLACPQQSDALCAHSTVEEKFHRADVVFSALVIGLSNSLVGENVKGSHNIVEIDYETLHVWKGDPGYAGTFRGHRGDRMVVGQTYLVFAKTRPEGLWNSGYCSGSNHFSEALEQRLILGEPHILYSPPPAAVTPEFLIAALDNSKKEACMAAELLAELGMQDALVEWARSREWDFSPGDSLDVLYNVLGAAGTAALPFVRELDSEFSASPWSDSRLVWIDLLGYLGEGEELAGWIRRGLADPEGEVRRTAGQYTGKLSGDTAQQLIKELEGQLSQGDVKVREYAAVALSHFKVLNPWTIDALCERSGGRDGKDGEFDRHCTIAVQGNEEAAKNSTAGKQVIADWDQ